jgi:hypothetical protein
MTDFDFFKAFSGVDLIQVDFIAKLVGHAEAALYQGMTEAGLSDQTALTILREVHDSVFCNLLASIRNQTDPE